MKFYERPVQDLSLDPFSAPQPQTRVPSTRHFLADPGCNKKAPTGRSLRRQPAGNGSRDSF
jgi:hypothetical protein